jgi:SAM-dependent methyltransferase
MKNALQREGDRIVAPSADVYYRGGYWNNYPEVVEEINRRISGRPDVDYLLQFGRLVGNRRFARGLFLNCGNGWVERDFLKQGLVDTAVGIDYSEELLERARIESAGLPVRYARVDINSADFPDTRYDLIVNVAACHHVAFIDRVLRELCARLTPDGWFVNYDYVGPHRNQYSYDQWSAVWETNNALPPQARQQLAYPHIPTMLATDPTEAIHSELVLETFRRYFAIAEFRAVGGAVAYPILTFNSALAEADAELRTHSITRTLDADARFLIQHPDQTLFAYWCATPRHEVLRDNEMLARWEHDENDRERRAADDGGRYYPVTLLESLVNSTAERQV